MTPFDATGHADRPLDGASRKTILAQSTDCSVTAPIRLSLFSVTRGHLVSTSDSAHWLGVHLGRPAAVHCSWGGPMQREVLETGSLYLRPAGQAATWYDEAATRFLGVALSPALVCRAAGLSGCGPAMLEPRLKFADLEIERICLLLKRELQRGEPNGPLFAEGLAMAFAARLVRHFGGRSEGRRPRAALAGPQLKRVLDFIEANLEASLSLASIATIAAMSPSSLKAMFRQAMGAPVHQYVIARRVERARQLLQEGELSPSDVAFSVGFANQSHLARWTRRLLEATPLELTGRR